MAEEDSVAKVREMLQRYSLRTDNFSDSSILSDIDVFEERYLSAHELASRIKSGIKKCKKTIATARQYNVCMNVQDLEICVGLLDDLRREIGHTCKYTPWKVGMSAYCVSIGVCVFMTFALCRLCL
ncbi:hypothetical protein CWI42_081170 [Ordospora colligata]|uniref:Uncharacterized protein n=1 Tax=Ordospora colligata OC4 TaxID=1354746 RepID=A0A0B2UE76_9MICR|nr:uncharacterized protein M896_081170 [Ordospora colligata OC4]KHN69381.1 hypothetical protein M896_081170 [Ordospora colligata OC4]TBU14895.1 hypothetical protein CWI41_081160 [Ordospora colligata]TBU15026.1 hypothetical protein CWI40_081180 [Ordospora colligata]TBU18280.1 hypothetical protein CWI42_081170 [Ordospora colligata]